MILATGACIHERIDGRQRNIKTHNSHRAESIASGSSGTHTLASYKWRAHQEGSQLIDSYGSQSSACARTCVVRADGLEPLRAEPLVYSEARRRLRQRPRLGARWREQGAPIIHLWPAPSIGSCVHRADPPGAAQADAFVSICCYSFRVLLPLLLWVATKPRRGRNALAVFRGPAKPTSLKLFE